MSADIVQSAAEKTLSSHLDEDVVDYVISLLSDDAYDTDARDSVRELINGSIDDEEVNAEVIVQEFFEMLDEHGGGGRNDNKNNNRDDDDGEPTIRKLTSTVTLKDHDITTFASGLIAATINTDIDGDDEDAILTTSRPSESMETFYANMIDVTNVSAMSERARRKARQKELREKMEEEERRRAVEDAMKMMEEDEEDEAEGRDEEFGLDDDVKGSADGDNRQDNASDVHLRNIDLPNLRGGGPDLLVSSSITLASGRRYGLMGRNGCGKTTLLTYLAGRPKNVDGGGIPRKMSMLLVRQEIMGNDWTAVETVLKSDVKREGLKRFIKWCEDELDKIEKGVVDDDDTNNAAAAEKTTDAAEEKATKKSASKSKQKLRDRKKNSAAAAKKKTSSAKNTTAKAAVVSDKQIEERKVKLNTRLSRAYQRLAALDEEEGTDPEPRARKVLAGLGFVTKEMQDKPTKELSGGWRMRVSLSCALFADPALLLLDEPTNHLDLEAVLWLEKYLTSKFKGTLVVVSHDRHFLNEVVTDVVHFHKNKLTTYRGDINNFTAVRDEDRKRQIRQREVQEAKRQHLQKYIDLHAQAGENGVKAAKQRKSRMKKLDKLGVMAAGEGKKYKASYDGDAEEIQEYEEDEEVTLTFPDPGAYDGDIVCLDRLSFGYDPNKLLLKDVDLSIDAKSRIALLGRNGCGKSTLIKLVVGALEPLKGKASRDGRAKIEYLAQHQLEQLDPDGTPMQTMLDRYPGDRGNAHALELRRYLANFGLGGDVLPKQKIHTMSGGQKCRLCLACAMYRKPHMLILDEPTNHLDLETTEALIEAIKTFKGGVLLVSHDQHLLTSVCKHLYVVENGQVERLRQGTTNGEAFEAYKKAVVQGRR
uniref:ABC transporter domain-containing protein n=2 Tax=Ditylum brightwellii TaxID=49249 RepID=A0A7S4QCT5_9STRA